MLVRCPEEADNVKIGDLPERCPEPASTRGHRGKRTSPEWALSNGAGAKLATPQKIAEIRNERRCGKMRVNYVVQQRLRIVKKHIGEEKAGEGKTAFARARLTTDAHSPVFTCKKKSGRPAGGQ